MKPMQAGDGYFEWFRVGAGDKAADESGRFDHRLQAAVFDRLSGGVLLAVMGIRRYPTEAEAMNAMRAAK